MKIDLEKRLYEIKQEIREYTEDEKSKEKSYLLAMLVREIFIVIEKLKKLHKGRA